MHTSLLLQIRPATPSDAALLAELGRRTFAEAFAADNTREDLALYLAQAFSLEQQTAELEDAATRTLLGEIDSVPVAYAQVCRGAAPECVPGERPLELRRFYVDARWHRQGVAHTLMDAVLHEADVLGALPLWLGVWERNPRAIAFYRKYGFERVGVHTFVLGTDPQTDWIMVRPPAP